MVNSVIPSYSNMQKIAPLQVEAERSLMQATKDAIDRGSETAKSFFSRYKRISQC